MNSKSATLIRCPWARNDLSIRYHDEEWGRSTHDDATLFEFLILEGAQAGLSWDTILKKRENYRAAFDSFDPKKIARYDRRKLLRLHASRRHGERPSDQLFPLPQLAPKSGRR
jgi:DNA-3-methyladenine glycosylase I